MDFGGKLCSKLQTRLLRWFLLCICWSTYILYRSFVVGQIKYNRKSGAMVIQPRNTLTIRIALFLKVLLFICEYFGIQYFLVGLAPLYAIGEDRAKEIKFLETLIEAVAIYITCWNIYRLYTWLRSLDWNRSFVRLVNKVIHLVSTVEGTSGPLRLEGNSLLIIYVVAFEFTLLHIINLIRRIQHLLVVDILLQEILYNAYLAYLFLLLSFIASFHRFLESQRMMALPILQQRQKIRQILHLYSRIINGHQDIIVLWLPVASVLFSNVVMMMGHWASIINIVLYNHDLDTAGKWNWVHQRHLGGALGPLLKILLIGLCNDRLAQLDRRLSLHLLLIDLRLLGDGERSQSFANELTILQTCFDLQLRAQPLRNPIMCKHQICDSPFALELIFCVLVNALSYVQYGISIGKSLDFQYKLSLLPT